MLSMSVTVSSVLVLLSLVSVTDTLQCYSCAAIGSCEYPGVTLACDDQDRSCAKQWRDGIAISWGCSDYHGPDKCLHEKSSGQVVDTTCYCQGDRCNSATRWTTETIMWCISSLFVLMC